MYERVFVVSMAPLNGDITRIWIGTAPAASIWHPEHQDWHICVVGLILIPNMHKHYYVNTRDGCGIRTAKDEEDVMRQMATEVGTDNVSTIREATPADIEWVRGMGGIIPEKTNK